MICEFMQIVSNWDSLHKCQILFSGENKKHITKLSSVELAQRVVKIATPTFSTFTAYLAAKLSNKVSLSVEYHYHVLYHDQ